MTPAAGGGKSGGARRRLGGGLLDLLSLRSAHRLWPFFPAPVRWSIRALRLALVAALLVVAGADWYTEPQARALVDLGPAPGDSVRLAGPLQVEWDWATARLRAGAGDIKQSRWSEYRRPKAPPALCSLGHRLEPALADPLAELADLRGPRRDPQEWQRRQPALQSLVKYQPRSPAEAFLRSYGVARAYYLLGDAAAAENQMQSEEWERRFLSPDVLRRVGGGPGEIGRDAARRLLREGAVDGAQVVQVFLGRYLMGLVALEQAQRAAQAAARDPNELVGQFRLALNPFNYLLDPEDVAVGHARRTALPLAGYACAGGEPDVSFSSLDAYVGLTAAYLAAGRPVDTPAGLRTELKRTTPRRASAGTLTPVLLYGADLVRGKAGEPGGNARNVVFAASNLADISYLNRPDADPRVEASRAALALMLASSPDWTTRLARYPGGTRCELVRGIVDDLSAPSLRVWSSADQAAGIDSALAAIMLEAVTLPTADTSCLPGQRLTAEQQAVLLRVSGPYVADGLPGRFERARTALQQALPGRDGGKLAAALDAAAASRRAVAERRWIPLVLLARVRGSDAWYAERWRRALYREVLAAADGAGGGAGSGPEPGDAAEPRTAAAALSALHACTRLAGTTMHAHRRNYDVAAAQATGLPHLVAWLRFWSLTLPGAIAGLALFAVLFRAVTPLVVGIWRVRLVATSGYRAERRRKRLA